jgi:hypothetical protein
MSTHRPRAFLVTCLFATLAAASASALPIQWTVGSGGNDHYYDAVSAPAGISWSQALVAAFSAGGYLATITSSAENGKSDRGERVPSGIYFCRIETATAQVVGRLVLIR